MHCGSKTVVFQNWTTTTVLLTPYYSLPRLFVHFLLLNLTSTIAKLLRPDFEIFKQNIDKKAFLVSVWRIYAMDRDWTDEVRARKTGLILGDVNFECGYRYRTWKCQGSVWKMSG